MTEKRMRVMGFCRMAGVGAAAVLLTVGGLAQGQAAKPQYGSFPTTPQFQAPPLPATPPITPNGKVVEDAVAVVNEQIITQSEYERAEDALVKGAMATNEHGGNVTQAELDEREKDLLRDMIDQQLLISKAKELGVSGDAETMRQLDAIRKENHMDSMEALQRAVEQDGSSFEDFKQTIKDQIIQQEVEREEIARHISVTHADEQAFYDAHKKDLTPPEQVHLSEILIPTPDDATDAQIAAAQAKADDAEAKLKSGTGFAELAKTVSGGPTAAQGGDLGDFKRGTLGDVLEKATFSLPAGGVTAPIRTRQGIVILRVDSHQMPVAPTFDAALPMLQEGVMEQKMPAALRAYLTKARDDAYIFIRQGFVDTGSNNKESKPTFTAYVPPAPKKKIEAKQRMEQEKAAQAQAALAASREKVAEKAAEKAAENAKKAGVQNVSMPVAPKKIPKEKIRYGQAPRNSLPAGTVVSATETAPLAGQAPGVAMASNDASVTTITTGTNPDADPMEGPVVSDHKVRFSDREKEAEEEHEKAKVKKTTAKAQARPAAATTQETADEKQQAAPLGLNGNTAPKKPVHEKGDPKERIQDKPAPTAPAEVTPAPTVNPALLGGPLAAPAANTTPTETTPSGQTAPPQQ